MRSLHEPFQSTSIPSLPTIMDNYRRILRLLVMLHTEIGVKIETCHTAEIDQYQVAVCTADGTSEVRVDISSVGTRR